MHSKKVVVTGGAGFIGSNLAMELSKRYRVTVIDNLSTGKLENIAHIPNIDFIEGSITNLGLLKNAFEGAECIFHEAALPSVQRSVDDPIASNSANVDGTLNVLVAARDCGAKKSRVRILILSLWRYSNSAKKGGYEAKPQIALCS